ncbi:hypothetical protein SESBI_29625 [Sesbania bispinosa]|nr:hypothetical protein SESBI_29625 [Sesbania bispinosa]
MACTVSFHCQSRCTCAKIRTKYKALEECKLSNLGHRQMSANINVKPTVVE